MNTSDLPAYPKKKKYIYIYIKGKNLIIDNHVFHTDKQKKRGVCLDPGQALEKSFH
jgi:hypothetical protein